VNALNAPSQPIRKPEDDIAQPGRPFTGAEYIKSLSDGREVYIYGE
jgi:4-hydroxyphenylacetate 3-monooxygenase